MDRTVADPENTGAGENLRFLCDWYRSNCAPELHDGDGIVIEAVDGPGWWLTIDLRDTSLEGNHAEPWVEDLGDGAWVQGWCDGTTFTSAASVDQLHVAVQWFRDFVRDVEEPRWQELLAG